MIDIADVDAHDVRNARARQVVDEHALEITAQQRCFLVLGRQAKVEVLEVLHSVVRSARLDQIGGSNDVRCIKRRDLIAGANVIFVGIFADPLPMIGLQRGRIPALRANHASLFPPDPGQGLLVNFVQITIKTGNFDVFVVVRHEPVPAMVAFDKVPVPSRALKDLVDAKPRQRWGAQLRRPLPFGVRQTRSVLTKDFLIAKINLVMDQVIAWDGNRGVGTGCPPEKQKRVAKLLDFVIVGCLVHRRLDDGRPLNDWINAGFGKSTSKVRGWERIRHSVRVDDVDQGQRHTAGAL